MSVIVRNTAIDALRLKTLPTTDLDLALLIPEPVPDGADEFDYDRARPIAATAIGQLPHDRQTLLSLAYIDGESRQSLSKRFGVPVGTIKTWLRRTLETVRSDCAAFEAAGGEADLTALPLYAPNSGERFRNSERTQTRPRPRKGQRARPKSCRRTIGSR